MKNNKILYILTLIITLFTFNTNAYAEEAVCTYKGTIKVDGKEETHYIYIHYGFNSTGSTKYVDLKELDPQKKAQDADYDKYVAEENRTFTVLKQNVKYIHKFNVDGIDANYMFNTMKGNCPSSIFVERPEPKLTDGPTENQPNEFLVSTTVYESKKKTDLKEYKFDSAKGNNPITGRQLQSEAEIEKENESEALDKQNDAKCTYSHEIKNSSEKHKIYMNYGKNENGIDFFSMSNYDPIIGNKKSGDIEERTLYVFSFEWEDELNADYIFGSLGGECPQYIWVDREYSRIVNHDPADFDETIFINTKVYKDSQNNTSGELYFLDGTDGNNPLTGEDLSPDGNINIDIHLEMIDIKNCKDLFGDDAEEITGYFNIAWNIVKFGVPIILLALGTLDFAQAVFAGKDDGMKKAQGKFIKRVIIAIAIFLVPTLISFLLGIANSIWGNIGTDLCGLLF